MSFCPKCGMQLPEGGDVRFCPNRGALLAPQAGQVKAEKERKAGVLSHRITVVAIVFILVVMTTFIGTMSKIDRSDAETVIEEINNLSQTSNVESIFGHNLMLTLPMFIPFLGTFWGFFVLYNTATSFAALSLVYHIEPLIVFASLFATPIFWLEYISYSLAISESLILAYAGVKRRFRNELVNASKVIAICAVLLLLSAFAEMALISSSLQTV